MIKKIISTALILTFILSVFCALPAHADPSVVHRFGDWYYGVNDDDSAIIYEYIGSETSLTIPGELNGHRVAELFSPFENIAPSLVSVSIPDGMERVDNGIFSGCTALKEVSIPESVTAIGNMAFSGCESLSKITIPAGVTEIGSSAFSGCTSLSGITLPEGLTVLGGGAFSDCTALVSIVLPDSLTVIGSQLFKGCVSLESVNFGDNISLIMSEAFHGCVSLKEIFIPASVTEIEGRALGYYVDDHQEKTYDLTILTPSASAAEEYAYRNRLRFVNTGAYIPSDPDETLNGRFVRLSDNDVFEVNKGEAFTLLFYTVGMNPIGHIWGNMQFNSRAIRGIDGELCDLDGEHGATMQGDFEVRSSGEVSFDLAATEDDRNLYAPYIASYPFAQGYEADAYVQPIFKVTMKINAEPGEYDIKSCVLSARDLDGRLLVGLENGYRDKRFSFGVVRVSDDAGLPFKPAGIRGDADEDGKVTVLDATRIQRYLASMIDDSGLDLKAADADLDGKVTVLDATRIQRVLANLCDMDGKTPDKPEPPAEDENPTAPHITKVESSNAGAVIKWDAFDGAEAYRVFWKTGSSSWRTLGDTEATSFTHSDAPYDTECFYTVCGISKNGEYTSDYDHTGYANTRLRTPNMKSAKLTDTYLGVSWDKVAGAAAYRVYIKGGAYTSWKGVCVTDVNYVDLSPAALELESGVKYSFTVRCQDGVNGSRLTSGHQTAGVSVVYYDTPFIYGIANAEDGTGIELYWTAVKGAAKYRIFVWNDSGWKRLTDTANTALLISGLTRGSYYRFTVRGLDSRGDFLTPYDNFGRMIEFDSTASMYNEGYSAGAIARNLEAAAAERGFSASASIDVDPDSAFILMLDSTAFYDNTNRMEEIVTQKSTAAMDDFVSMLKRVGEKPSDYCFSIETEPDEDDEIWFYLVVARRTDA